MADIEQWVNLTKLDKWKGDGLDERANMGRRLRLNIQMAEHRRATLFVKKEPNANNIAYSPAERRRRAVFHAATYNRRRVRTDRNGEVQISVFVTASGGDEYDITVTDRDGNEIQADVIKTRRKLYFQVIKMAGVAALSAADIQGMIDEFWNEPNNLYIKLVEHTPGKTIPSMRNMNDEDRTVDRTVKNQARAEFDQAKNPYSFAALVVRRNGIPGNESQNIAATFDATNSFSFNTRSALFDNVDPAVEYYVSLRWIPDAGGSANIAKAKLTRLGTHTIRIDTTGLVQGAGRLAYNMIVCTINGRGFSDAGNNFTLVASEDAITGAAVPANEIMAVFVHETAHKIGMVPGPQGTRVLDTQSTHYTAHGHHGAHCHHGVPDTPANPLPANLSTTGGINPDCTMFGDTRAATSHFCPECLVSVRKLDLRANTNRGIRTQF